MSILNYENIVEGIFLFPKILISFISPHIPVKNDLAVYCFGNNNYFAGNCKYLFLDSANEGSDVRNVAVGLSRELAQKLSNRGYEVYTWRSLTGLYLVLRAKYVFYSTGSRYWYLDNNSKVIQMWHGSPLKKLGKNVKNNPFDNPMLKYLVEWYRSYCYRNNDYFLTTSEYVSELFESLPGFDTGETISLGYPRNDIFFREIEGSDVGINKKELEKIKHNSDKVVFYLPTWRQYDTGFEFDFERINSYLMERGISLYISFHPKECINLKNDEYKNIFVVQSTDKYPLLCHSDALITDYSSVLYDYLLLDNPMVFFPYDLTEYNEKRGLLQDYVTHVPGPVARTEEKLLSCLGKLDQSNFKEERNDIKKKFHDNCDGRSCQRMRNMIFNRK